MSEREIYYLCDRKACKSCRYPECTHTSNAEHAVNFANEENALVENNDDINRIKTLNVKPNDILVVEAQAVYHAKDIERIEEQLSKKIGCKVRLLCGGMKATEIVKAE